MPDSGSRSVIGGKRQSPGLRGLEQPGKEEIVVEPGTPGCVVVRVGREAVGHRGPCLRADTSVVLVPLREPPGAPYSGDRSRVGGSCVVTPDL